MKLTKQIILAITGVLLLLTGCHSTPKPQLTANEVIKKARQAISSKPNFNNLDDFKIKGKILVFGSNTKRTEKNITLYYLKPEKYLYKEKIIFNNPDGSVTENTRRIFTNGKEIIWKTENDKNINMKKVSHDDLVKINQTIKECKALITFSLFLVHFDMHLANYPLKNYYELSSKLEVPSRDGSNEYKYYIDKKNFHLIKVNTEYGTVKNIKYKNINGINFPYKYHYIENGVNPSEFYIEIEDVKYNVDIDKSIFLNPKSKNAKEI